MTDGVRQCSNPSDETFLADPPASLLAAATASGSTSLTLTPTAAVTPTGTVAAPSAASTASSSSSSHGISAGAAAGIGVGAGVGGILIVAAIAFFVVRWLRRRKAQEREGATMRPGSSRPPGEPTPMYPGGASMVDERKSDVKKDNVVESPPPGPGAPLLGHNKSRRELDSTPVARDEEDANRLSELPGQQPANRPTVELDGSEVGR